MPGKKLGGGNKCGRCGTTVYHAEAALAGKQHYHNSCFSCKRCGRKLERGTVCVAEKEGEIYCNPCYKAEKGQAGYGYGLGSGALSMDAGGGKTGSGFEAALAGVPGTADKAPAPVHAEPAGMPAAAAAAVADQAAPESGGFAEQVASTAADVVEDAGGPAAAEGVDLE